MSEWKTVGKTAHAESVDRICEFLKTSSEEGLSHEEAKRRLRACGFNQLEKQSRRSWVAIFIDQLKGVVIWVLVAALAVALALAEWPEAIAIAAVILVNTLIGFVAEWRATRTIDALREQEESHVHVRRGGETETLPIRNLVPGDLIEVEAGELVPADARVVESEGLRLNEAALSGESEPVSKGTEPVDEDAPLAERSCLLFKGCSIMDGSGRAVVTATGMRTELGQIARAAMEAESTEAPLGERLDQLGRQFVGLVFVSVILVGLAGWWRGREPTEVIETAIALGIAAVPEGLPIVATIALAHGMWKMGKHNAVVKHLQAVQALGSVPYLFVDKTGTLTLNRMQLIRVETPSENYDFEEGEESPGDRVKRVLEVGVLCNGASLEDSEDETERGDPMEVALLEAGRRSGIERETLLQEREEVRVIPFDRETMMMAAFNRDTDGQGITVSVKGAPERVLEACERTALKDELAELDDDRRAEWTERANDLAGKGYRILGAAEKTVDAEDAEAYSELTFLGFFALEDPPREDVADSIDECEAAGIKVIMVTGDKPETAEAIARQSGIGEEGAPIRLVKGNELRDLDTEDVADEHAILEADVIARVEPQQKMDLVELAQAGGAAAAMTGDGVNDAPALKRANVGIAMGERGTEAAKQVADIVLRDDSLATIVEAVRRGRTIMDNIRKAVMFFLCTNLAEMIALTIGAALDYPLPLLALQILYLNVITDVFPALALGVGPPDQNVMQRRDEKENRAILSRTHWLALVLLGLVLAATTLTGLILGKEWLGLSDAAATTLSFMTLGLSKVWFPFNLRDYASPVWRNEITRNPYVWWAAVLCLGLLALAVAWRPLGRVLETVPLPPEAWGLVLALSLVPFVLSQLALIVLARRAAKKNA
ncbi:MAG: cation-translocating P-type ATPase [Verrucomicrobiota bacterium]